MATAQTVARYFLAFANECHELITNLKLNKLVYYAQSWHLALCDEPLFEDPIEAWIHGPVIPNVYVEFKSYSYRPILDEVEDLDTLKHAFTPSQCNVLDEVIDVYFAKSAYALEQLTHQEDPWLLARDGLPRDAASHNVIEPDIMKHYYAMMVEMHEEDEKDDPGHFDRT